VIAPPRASGTETIIISANWLSLSHTEAHDPLVPKSGIAGEEGHVRGSHNVSTRNPNLRGIAEVLTFAAFLRGKSLWLSIPMLPRHILETSVRDAPQWWPTSSACLPLLSLLFCRTEPLGQRVCHRLRRWIRRRTRGVPHFISRNT
jgi:hypothetical protein